MASRHKKLVPDDKFDRHFKRAKASDTSSRKTIFDNQTEDSIKKADERKQIKSSYY